MELALNLLISTHDQDVNVVKEAENMLKTMESEPGFFTFLLKVILDQTQNFNARFSAAIYFKNAIKRCWNRIHGEEKNDIKRKLLFFYELEPQIYYQMLFVVVEIANNEFPDTWPELLPFMLSAILSHDKRHKYKAYSVLFEIVRNFRKKYKTNREEYERDEEWIATDQKLKTMFEEIISTSFVAIYQSWTQLNSQFLLALKSNISELGELEQTPLLALKILYNLVSFGNDFSPEILTFISDVTENLKPFVEICISSGKSSEILGKYITFLTKTLKKVFKKNKPSCVHFVLDIFQNCLAFCFTKEFQDIPDCLLCFFMRLMGVLLKYGRTRVDKYKYDAFKDYKKQKVISSILNASTVKEVCHQLVYKYLPLTKSDLQLWVTDPEEYASQEFGGFAKYNCHEAARSFLEVMLWRCDREVKNEIIKEFNRLLSVPANDISGIIAKDAAYQAYGLTTFHIRMDCHEYENVLLTLLSELKTCHCILRRRIVWLFMRYTRFYEITTFHKYALHGEVLHLMNHDESLVVRLEAARFFKEQNRLRFQETISPEWEQVFESLFKMLEDINPCDLKMFILHVIYKLIKTMGKKMSEFSHSVLRLLLDAWNNSGHHMIKNAIMMSCTKLLEAGIEWDENLLQPVISWIALSTDESEPLYDSYFENALDLWVAVVQIAEEKNSDVLDLANNLLTLEFNTQNICTVLKIIKCYLLLYKDIFIQKFGMSLVQTLTSLKADFNEDDWEHVLKFIGTVFTMYPKYGPHLFKPFLSGLLGTSIIKYDNCATVKSLQVSVISRILFCNELCFGILLEVEAQARQTNVDVCLNDLMNIFNDCIMGERSAYFHEPDFKLMALGLTSLLTMDFNAVRNNIQNITSLILRLWEDIRVDGCVLTDKVIEKSLNYIDDKYCKNYSEKLENALKRRDFVYTTSLGELFCFQIFELTKIIGMENFLQSISTCNKEDIRTIQNLLNMLN